MPFLPRGGGNVDLTDVFHAGDPPNHFDTLAELYTQSFGDEDWLESYNTDELAFVTVGTSSLDTHVYRGNTVTTPFDSDLADSTLHINGGTATHRIAFLNGTRRNNFVSAWGALPNNQRAYLRVGDNPVWRITAVTSQSANVANITVTQTLTFAGTNFVPPTYGIQVHDHSWPEASTAAISGGGGGTGGGTGLSAEDVRDTVAAFIRQGTGITVTHNDSANTLTIASTIVNTDTQLTTEEVQDIVAAFIRGGSNVTVTYDDSANTLTVTASGGGGGGGSARAFGSGSGEIATWAEGDSTATLPDGKIASGITRDSELAAHATRAIQDGDIPAAITRDSELAAHATRAIQDGDLPASITRDSELAAHATRALQDGDIPAAIARDTEVTTASPQVWQNIPNGGAVAIGKVATHGGAYFGSLTNHTRGGTGPDGDPTNWVLLSNYRGDWVAAWYPVGSIVSRGGFPWVATSAVTINDPAPDAGTNTKWLRLGADTSLFAQLAGATFTGAVRGIAPVDDADFTRKDYVDIQAATPGTPPREITAGAGGTYTLRDAENELHVDVEITHNTQGTRTYTDRILRAELTSTPVDHVLDGRNPSAHASDNDSNFVGFAASISGNVVTLTSGSFQGTITHVWGIVSGAQGEKGDKGDPGAEISSQGNTNARISALEEVTDELALEDHEIWNDETTLSQYAIFAIPSPVSGLTTNLPGYAWASTVTIPSNGNYIIGLRLATGRSPNWVRVVRNDDGGTQQEIYRGGFHYAGLEQGGFVYYIRTADAMMEDDVLTLQRGIVDAHTRYAGEVTKLDEHEALPSAHQDSPRRETSLSVGAPIGRVVYLTETINHPNVDHIFNVGLEGLANNNDGASVIDLSGETFDGVGGPDVADDVSGYPAVINAARIGALWQNKGGNVVNRIYVAVNQALGTPTHLHVSGVNNDLRSFIDRTLELEAQRVDTITVGAVQYRIMRTTVGAGALFDNIIQNTGDSLNFSLRYSGGYLKADGTIDTGIDYTPGQYRSLGSGQWLNIDTEVENFAKTTQPETKFPEARYNLRDGQLVYGLTRTFTHEAGTLGDSEWQIASGNANAIAAKFSTSTAASAFAMGYPIVNPVQRRPLRINEDEYMATVTIDGTDNTLLVIDIGTPIPSSYTGLSLAIRPHSELVSLEAVEGVAQRRASAAVSAVPVRRYPQTVRLFGRFADSALSGGVPATAPDIVFDDLAGASLVDSATSPWSFPEAGTPTGTDPLWVAETSVTYVTAVEAWAVANWIYYPVSGGALLYSTNYLGTNASDTPQENWTYFAFRRSDGSLSEWIPRPQTPDVRHHLFASFRHFNSPNGMSTHYSDGQLDTLILPFNSEFINLYHYDRLEFEWRSYLTSSLGSFVRFSPQKAVLHDVPSIFIHNRMNADLSEQRSRNAYYRGVGMVRVVFGGVGNSWAAVIDSLETVTSPGITASQIAVPGGSGNVSGAVIDMKFRGDNIHSPIVQISAARDLLIHAGSHGAGRLDIYGVIEGE